MKHASLFLTSLACSSTADAAFPELSARAADGREHRQLANGVDEPFMSIPTLELPGGDSLARTPPAPRDPAKDCPAPTPAPTPDPDCHYHTTKSGKSGKSGKSHGPEQWGSWGSVHCHHAKPEPKAECSPKGDTCKGYSSYAVIDSGDAPGESASWTYFEGLTPPGCVLAPITSIEEYWNLRLEVQRLTQGLSDGESNVWIGVVKSPWHAMTDNNGEGSRANWQNLDGSPAAVCETEIWWNGSNPNNEQPNNKTPQQTRIVMLWDGRLRDLEIDPPNAGNDQKNVRRAVYKCCRETVTFDSCDILN